MIDAIAIGMEIQSLLTDGRGGENEWPERRVERIAHASEPCDGAVFVECGDCVFVDGAMRALPRAAARAQSSAEAVVLAIAAILVSRCLLRSVHGLLRW